MKDVDEILALPRAEKIELMYALAKSIAHEMPPLDEATTAVIDERLAAFEANPDDTIPWELVKAEMLNRK